MNLAKTTYWTLLDQLLSRRIILRKLPYLTPRVRSFLLRRWGAEISETATLHTPFFIENLKPFPIDRRLRVGPDTYIGSHALFDLKGGVTIGARVTIAYRCTFLSHVDVGQSHLAESYPAETNPVTIGDDVYMGANVTVLPGVTIGNGSVIAAGSVVSSDIEAGVVAAGVPAKKLRSSRAT